MRIALLSRSDDGAARVATSFLASLPARVRGGNLRGGRLVEGAHLIAGEWGTSFALASRRRIPGPGLLLRPARLFECWISVPRSPRIRASRGPLAPARAIAKAALGGDAAAVAAMFHIHRSICPFDRAGCQYSRSDAIVLGAACPTSNYWSANCPNA